MALLRFIYDTIYLSEVYNPVVFSIFLELRIY